MRTGIPAVALSQSALNFDGIDVGQASPPQTVVLRNTGRQPVSVTAPPAGSEFSWTTSCATVLLPEQQCQFDIVFRPAQSGERQATLAIETSAGKQNVMLIGMGLKADLSVSASTVNFGAVQVGQAALSQSVLLENTGNATLTGLSYTTTSGFSVAASNCAAELPAGQSCSLQVVFQPTASQSYSGSLTISATNAQSKSVSLTGTAQSASTAVSTSSLSFADTLVGASSPTKTVQLINSGVGPVTVGAITTSAGFSGAHNCPETLAAGQSCSVEVSFTPQTRGVTSGELTISTSATTHVVTLSATALQAVLDFETATANFGSVQLGEYAEFRGTTLTNTGNTAANNLTISVGEPFSIAASTCGTSLAAGQSCSVNIRFTPEAETLYIASLSASAAAGAQPSSATMVGAGINRTVSGSVNFGGVELGSSRTVDAVNVTNNTDAWVYVGMPQVSGPFATVASACTNSMLAPGETCNLQASFTPTVAGSASGTYTLPTSLGVVQLSLSGSGTQAILSVSPSSIAFAPTSVGKTATSALITLTNTGTATAKGITGTIATAFSLTETTCPANLAAGASCTFKVTFTPTAVQPYGGQLTVQASNAAPTVLSLSGDGALDWNFGTVSVGTTSASRSLNLNNPTNSPIPVNSVTVSGPFVITSNNCGATIPAGSMCTLSAAFRPTAAGPATGLLTIFLQTGTFYVNLSGAGS